MFISLIPKACLLNLAFYLQEIFILLLTIDPGIPSGCQPIIRPSYPVNCMKMKKDSTETGGSRPKLTIRIKFKNTTYRHE